MSLKTNRCYHLTLITLTLALTWGLASCKPSETPQDSQKSASPASETQTESPAAQMSESDKALWERTKGLFETLPSQPESPATNPTTSEKVALGKQLYYDPRLSKSGAISCASCHNLASYGVDNRPTSVGHGFQLGGRNAPTVLNAAYNFSQFWDGRAADLEAQAEGPVLNPIEMAMPDEASVLKRLSSIPEYREAFKKAFPEEAEALTYHNTAKAIAAFERTLITPAPFDKFLAGDGNALTAEQKAGLDQFMTQGCAACHSGKNMGGSIFQKFGVVNPYPHQKDLGRYEVTHEDKDKYFFKVPTLRNITKTYPYFHDGQVWDIHEAVKIMGKTQLGKDLKPEEIDQIVSFLGSLTGELPEAARTLPTLPASQPDTPKPQI